MAEDDSTGAARIGAMDRVAKATAAIQDALAFLPETQLWAAIQSGFRLWPYAKEEALPEFLRTVLRTIVEQACAATGAQMGALGIGDLPERPFDPWVFVGVAPETAAAIGRYPRAVGTFALVAREGKVVRERDVRTHPAFAGFPPHHPEVSTFLGVPIRYRGRSVGNLYLGNKRDGGEFTEEDQRVVELLATHAALALQQAYLLAAVEAQRAQMQGVLESAPSGILFIDTQSGNVMANPRATQILGHPLRPDAGRDQYEGQVCAPDGRPLALEELPSTHALRGQAIASKELLVIQPDGRRIPVVERAGPVRGVDGRVLGAVVIFEEVSATKELERLREEFIAVVAHDLRDPIQAILLQVQALLRRAARTEVRAPTSAVRQIERSALRLGQMTSDMIDATRIELKRMSLDLQPADAGTLAKAVVERLRPALGPHPIEVRVQSSPPPALLDPARFDQALENLLENAAAYSGEGAPIRVQIAPEAGGVAISVQDRGVGIAPEELPRLFDRFYQARRAREKKTGLGLGLYITKGLAEAHGGRIQVRSQPGRGSTFTLWFPAAPHAPGAEAAPAP